MNVFNTENSDLKFSNGHVVLPIDHLFRLIQEVQQVHDFPM